MGISGFFTAGPEHLCLFGYLHRPGTVSTSWLSEALCILASRGRNGDGPLYGAFILRGSPRSSGSVLTCLWILGFWSSSSFFHPQGDDMAGGVTSDDLDRFARRSMTQEPILTGKNVSSSSEPCGPWTSRFFRYDVRSWDYGQRGRQTTLAVGDQGTLPISKGNIFFRGREGTA